MVKWAVFNSTRIDWLIKAALPNLTGCGVGDFVTGDTPACNQKIFNLLGDHNSVGNLKIPARGRNVYHTVSVQELWKNADGAFETGFIFFIVLGDIVFADNLSRFPHSQR